MESDPSTCPTTISSVSHSFIQSVIWILDRNICRMLCNWHYRKCCNSYLWINPLLSFVCTQFTNVQQTEKNKRATEKKKNAGPNLEFSCNYIIIWMVHICINVWSTIQMTLQTPIWFNYNSLNMKVNCKRQNQTMRRTPDLSSLNRHSFVYFFTCNVYVIVGRFRTFIYFVLFR